MHHELQTRRAMSPEGKPESFAVQLAWASTLGLDLTPQQIIDDLLLFDLRERTIEILVQQLNRARAVSQEAEGHLPQAVAAPTNQSQSTTLEENFEPAVATIASGDETANVMGDASSPTNSLIGFAP